MLRGFLLALLEIAWKTLPRNYFHGAEQPSLNFIEYMQDLAVF